MRWTIFLIALINFGKFSFLLGIGFEVLELADGGAAELVRLRPALQADDRLVGRADVVVRLLKHIVY